MDGVDERIELHVPALSPRWMEILADALAKIPRLAHIDHCAKAVLHQVDTGLVRHRPEFLSDLFGGGH